MEDRSNWGDLYIGLHLAAQTVQGVNEIAVTMPLWAMRGRYSTLGSPSIWEDIAIFFRGIGAYLSPWHWATDLFVWALNPVLAWVEKSIIRPWTVVSGSNWVSFSVWVSMWWEFIKAEARARFDSIIQPFTNLKAWFVNDFPKEVTKIKDAVLGLPLLIYNYFAGWLNWGKSQIQTAYFWWISTVYPWLGSVAMALAGIPMAIKEALVSFWLSLGVERDRLVAWWDNTAFPWIKKAWLEITDLPTKLYDKFLTWYDWGKLQVTNAWSKWNSIVWPWLSALPSVALAGVKEWFNGVWGVIVGWINAIHFWVKVKANQVRETMLVWLNEWFAGFLGLPSTFLNWVASTAGTNLALNPGRALATVGSLYTMSLAAGTGAHILATCLNAIPTTNWVGAAQLSAYIAQAAGFDPLTKATYGVLIEDALTWPMRYHWNQMLRPRIPTEGSIYAMGRKRGINRSEFGKAMAFHGLPDWWIDKEYSFFWADPSPYWLLRMSEFATPAMRPSAIMQGWLAEWLPNWRADPWGWYKMKLMLAGFEDTDIQPFIDGFEARRLGPAVTQVKTSIRAMLREGYWTFETALGRLRNLKVRDEESELIRVAEAIDFANRYRDDQQSYYLELFRKGQISLNGLRTFLSAIIVDSGKVALIAERERVRALPKSQTLMPSTESSLIQSLTRKAADLWSTAYQRGEIALEELEFGLTIAFHSPDLARARAAGERSRPPEPYRAKAPREPDPVIRQRHMTEIARWVSRFRAGETTAEELELGLASLLPNTELVSLTRQLEELRVCPAPDVLPPAGEEPLMATFRAEAVQAHLAMFQDRLIGLRTLYAYLVADGLAEALARETALAQAMSRVTVAPFDSPYFTKDHLQPVYDEAISGYTHMLEQGYITLAGYKTALLAVGIDVDVATGLTDTQELRQFIRTGVTA